MAITTYSDNSLDEVERTPPTPSPLLVAPAAARVKHFADESETPTQSALEYFIASFFQEKNIRWMLVIGAAIVDRLIAPAQKITMTFRPFHLIN